MAFNDFIKELRRRNVIKAAISYIAVSWLVLQAASIVFSALEFSNSAMRILIAVLLIGFFPWVIISWIYDYTSSGFQKTEERELGEPISKSTGKHLNTIIIGSLSLAVLILLADRIFNLANHQKKEEKKVSIAVMPFKSKLQDSVYSLIGQDISDELRTKLIYISSIKTMAEYTSDRLDSMNLTQLDKNLNITHLVRGSIKQSKDSIVVLANMVDVNTEVLTGLGSFQFSKDNLLSIVDEIKTNIISILDLAVKKEEAVRMAQTASKNPEARILLQQGKFLLSQYTPDKINESVTYLTRAIKLDSQYADAYVMRALANFISATWHGDKKLEQVIFTILEDLDKALDINPKLASAYIVKATVDYIFKWDFESAEFNFKKAYELNVPGNSLENWYGFFLLSTGRYEQAVEILEIEHKLDPINEQIMVDLGAALYWSGKKNEAFAMYEQGLELNENHPNLYFVGFLHFLEGNFEECLEAAKNIDRLEPEHVPQELVFEGYINAKNGNREEVEKIMDQIDQLLLEERNKRWVPYTLKADYYILLGDKEKALDYLQKALDERENSLSQMIWWGDIFYSSLKEDSVFIQIQKEIGLEAFL